MRLRVALVPWMLLAACAGRTGAVPYVPRAAPTPMPAALVDADVGRLLSADPEVSRRAAERLTTLDEAGREALAAHAALIPAERDPRWLHVLDENHALPTLAPDEEVTYLLWKVQRPEAFYVMKAQSRLLDLARRAPDALADRLAAGGPGTEALAVALGLSGDRRAVPPLLARYRSAASVRERHAWVEALGPLVGERLKPRATGTAAQIEADAAAIEAWWAAQDAEDPR